MSAKKKTQVSIESLETRTMLAYTPLQIGGKYYDSGYQTAVDAQGDTIVAGIFQGKATFGTAETGNQVTMSSVGQTDIFIVKYDPSGKVIWAGQIGGGAGKIADKKELQYPIDPSLAGGFVNPVGIEPGGLGEYVNGMALDANGNVFLTGTFLGSADFDPGPGHYTLKADPTYKLYDAFLVKLNSSGSLVWADAFGGPFNDAGNAVAVDPQGNPIVTGYFTRLADFNPTKAVYTIDATGRDDIFVAKYSGPTGKLVWVDTAGGDATDISSRDAGNAITTDAQGNIYVTGTFAGNSVDFDPGPGTYLLHSVDRDDAFVWVLSPRGKRVMATSFGGKGYDGGEKIAVVGGKIYTASYFQGDVTISPGGKSETVEATGNNDFTDLLVTRLSLTGAMDWADQISGDAYETIGGFAVNSSGSVYISGGFYDTVDFDPGPGHYNLTSIEGDDKFDDQNDNGRKFSYDIYVSRYSSVGTLQAATRIGSVEDDFGTGLALSADQSTLTLTGQFRGTVPFDSADGSFKHKSFGAEDAFLIQLSAGLKLLT